MGVQALVATTLLATLLLQALFPGVRVLIVLTGAAATSLATSVAGLGTLRELLGDVPWDVIVILVALGLLSELLVASRAIGVLAVAASRWCGGNPGRILAIHAVGMYVVSSLANNLTALLLVLPILLVHLKLIGTTQRALTWTLGILLVACNLGGAATPIGDFPAVLLLGRGSMTFAAYLVNAGPATLVALAAVLTLALGVARPGRDVAQDGTTTRLSIAVMEALYRNVRVDRKALGPPLAILGIMLVAWTLVPPSSGLTPELICWIGVSVALLLRPNVGERLARTRVDVEAVLFLLALFLMVAAVRRTGLFVETAHGLDRLDLPPLAELLIFLVVAGVLTGLFSAGPSMAAMLDVAEPLARRLPPNAVYVGLALSVCAGSSLFLTAATSGPLAQALTERAGLRDHEGRPLRFGFYEFLPVGILSFLAIQTVAILYAAIVTLAP